jgi:alpha-galactosidase/6-phospho-beta-glucosidase family protein
VQGTMEEANPDLLRRVRVDMYRRLAEGTGRTFSNVCDLTVRAVLEGGLDHVRHAALLDPNTAASLTLDEIDTLVAELLDAYRDLLRESLR